MSRSKVHMDTLVKLRDQWEALANHEEDQVIVLKLSRIYQYAFKYIDILFNWPPPAIQTKELNA